MQDIEAIVETRTFSRDAKHWLSAAELQALRVLLAYDPLVGDPSEEDEAIRVIVWRLDGTLQVEYLVAPSKIFLLAIQAPEAEDEEEARVGRGGGSRLRELLDTVRSSGIGWGVKEVLDACRHLLGL
jgi:hypothetical protein